MHRDGALREENRALRAFFTEVAAVLDIEVPEHMIDGPSCAAILRELRVLRSRAENYEAGIRGTLDILAGGRK